MFGRLPRVLGRLAALLGLYAAYTYAAAGLSLSHYDAKAHLVVARRILDSLTPGWEQVGAVWLPLPHLLNMLPVQIDHLYRTGGSAIAISVLAYALTVACLSSIVLLVTASPAAAVLAATLFATNPNVLYLQATPMTEPLFFGLSSLQVWLFTRWVMDGAIERPPRAAGWATVLACLTRYEAWPITVAVWGASLVVWWRRGAALGPNLRAHLLLSCYPFVAVAAFLVFSRITVGEWFVSGGFFVPDEALRGNLSVVYEKIVEGATLVAGPRFVRIAQISAAIVIVLAVVRRERTPMLVPLALFGAVALPLAAYLEGHPFRLRYEIPLVVAGATVIGLAVGQLRGWARPVAAFVFLLVSLQRSPFDPRTAVVAEAQLDAANSRGRARVTQCLRRDYRGGTIMASMGSLGHYMQELSHAGFDIRDFLHEGNGPIWDSAFTRGPAPFVEWVLVEEEAEGGDAIAQRQRGHSRLLANFERVCSGGNVALYRRRDQASGVRGQRSGMAKD